MSESENKKNKNIQINDLEYQIIFPKLESVLGGTTLELKTKSDGNDKFPEGKFGISSLSPFGGINSLGNHYCIHGIQIYKCGKCCKSPGRKRK